MARKQSGNVLPFGSTRAGAAALAGGLALIERNFGQRPYDSFIQKIRAIEAGKVVEIKTWKQRRNPAGQ